MKEIIITLMLSGFIILYALWIADNMLISWWRTAAKEALGYEKTSRSSARRARLARADRQHVPPIIETIIDYHRRDVDFYRDLAKRNWLRVPKRLRPYYREVMKHK